MIQPIFQAKFQPVYKKLAAFALIVVLSCSSTFPIFADGVTPETPSNSAAIPAPSADEVIANTSAIGSVFMNDKDYFELKQVAILPRDEDKIVTFTVTVNNGEDKDIEFIDYWLRLNNLAGAQFTINLMPEDKDKNRIPPHSSLDFHFYSKVNSSVNLQDLNFTFIQWDFSADNYERKLGEIAIPESYTDVTPQKTKRILPVSGTLFKTAASRVTINKNDDNYLVSLDYAIENVGLKSAKLPAYSYAIYTSEGILYPLELAGGADTTITPRMKKELQLKTVIPTSVQTSGWRLLVTKEDPVVKTMPVAVYELPQASVENESTTTTTRSIEISDIPVSTGITRASISKTDTTYIENIFFSFANNGTKAVTVPNYQFTVTTDEGFIYPLTAAAFNNLSLNPKESKEIQLSVNIPLSVKVNNLAIQLIQPGTSGKEGTGGAGSAGVSQSYPIASYKVPKSTVKEVSVGIDFPFTNQNGTYSAVLNTVQRVPWEDQDIISADISVSNKGKTSVNIPTLQGYFLLDGNVKVDAKLVEMDRAVSIPAKSSVSYVLMSKIPYTSQFSSLKLVLQEKISEKDATTLAEFAYQSDLMTIPTLETDAPYLVSNTGKSSELRVNHVYTYSGTNSDTDIFYIDAELKNLEKRSQSASKLAAYVKTVDDNYYPAIISDVTRNISPGTAKNIVIRSELPKGWAIESLLLMIGLAVDAGDSKSPTNGYVRVAQMNLHGDPVADQSTLENLIVQPYTISLSNAKTRVSTDGSGFKFNFDYTLTKAASLVPDDKTLTHKLVVEIADAYENKFESKFDLDQATGLIVGSGSLKFEKTFSSLEAQMDFLKAVNETRKYTLNIYDEFGDGYRRLLSSTTKDWYPN